DRAVHGVDPGGVRPDAEPVRDSRAKAFEHDVGTRDQRLRESPAVRRVEVADDRLFARVERLVPRRRRRTQRVALRRLDQHNARTKPEQLPPRVRARQEARQVDDEEAGEWRHDRTNLYKLQFMSTLPARIVPFPRRNRGLPWVLGLGAFGLAFSLTT